MCISPLLLKPSGLILQWGNSYGSGIVSVTPPISFPNSILNATATLRTSGIYYYNTIIHYCDVDSTNSLLKFAVSLTVSNNSSTGYFNWTAIGY